MTTRDQIIRRTLPFVMQMMGCERHEAINFMTALTSEMRDTVYKLFMTRNRMRAAERRKLTAIHTKLKAHHG